MRNLLGFKEVEFDSDNDLLFAIEDFGNTENNLKDAEKQWLSVWMLEVIGKSKLIEMFQYQSLGNVVKAGGEEVVKNFGI